jgi:outer membrane protein assembly factor BamE (lipoprotein component of BamABCDE complex)
VTGQVPSASGASGGAPSAIPTAPASIELGQTPDQVQAALGAPARVANLGSKVIYYYDGQKVIFKDGKVSDVQ